jgi:hypothetical protein
MSILKNFLEPRLTGKRFDDHSIPLEILEDFAALEELLLEMAKKIYLEKNTHKQRVPKGFMDRFSLRLSGINAGSAVPKIDLYYLSPENQSELKTAEIFVIVPPYLEEARDRIISGIEEAESGGKVLDYIPEEMLSYFNRIGKRLKEDETLYFSTAKNKKPVPLNRSIRKKLVLASSTIKEVTSEINIIALIPEADKGKKTFTLQLPDSARIQAPIPDIHFETIITAFNRFEDKYRVAVKGIGRFNQYDKLQIIDTIEHISIIDPLDVSYRLEELAVLHDGWLDGEGVAPDKSGLLWFNSEFQNYFDDQNPLPRIYPTISGGIQAEWTINQSEISLEIDLNKKTGIYHIWNMLSDTEENTFIDFNNREGWSELNEALLKLKENK